MFNQLYLVLLLAPFLVISSSVSALSNRTEDAALFSSSAETVLGAKGGHLVTTSAPVIVKHASHQAPEEHSKLTSLITSKGNASSESTSHKITETTKLEPAKSIGHGVTNSTKVETGHSTSTGTKSDSAHAASHNVSTTVKVDVHKPESTKAPVSVSLSSSATADKIANTVKHVVANSVSNAASKSEEHAHTNETVHKFCDYIKPICESADKIVPKSLFKVQTQFKQLVHLTSGKLSTCFSEHFSFDPNLKPVSVAELKTLCSSKNLSPSSKGSYKAFADCAAAHWNPAVDKELDRIIEARINCTKNHQHSKNVTTISLADHESDDEMSLISEVVSKVLEGDKSAGSLISKNSEIKVLDFSLSTTHKPAASNSSSALKQILKQASTTSMPTSVKNLLNDPNTVVVFLDDSKTTKKSASLDVSTTVKVNTTSASSGGSTTTSKPAPIHSAVKLDLPSNVKLTLGLNKEPTPSPTPANKTTSSSLAHKILSTESSAATSSKPVVIVVSTTAKPSSSSATTKKVEIIVGASKSPIIKVETAAKASSSSASTGSQTTVKVASTAAPPTVLVKPLPPKPLESITELMARQEKEKSEFESRLRAEREKMMKQLQKKQDEFEAQNAIKSLQIQREASANHDSESRLHQLEHDRQMTIDPIGHTMKHQQYEMSKQQKAMSG